ncbi:protein DpdE [Plasticicumulans sp.]|uniref:protein DpdE n=1 Tax=Plasticicumulans sp. TaxID=2307179 RepID=UPI003944308A
MRSTNSIQAVHGAFVRIKSGPHRSGDIGKLVSHHGKEAVVRFFDVPDDTRALECRVPITDLKLISLAPQTRVFHALPDGRWRVGRVLDGEGETLYVRFPNGEDVALPRDEIEVRWQRPIRDPLMFLTREITESPYFATARSAFLTIATAQRAACLGMSAVLSAQIELQDYQFEVVRRVLQDPVQRYLLADEVGLGKTIEAGILLRQFFLDHPRGTRAVVVGPPSLIDQWREELESRFGLTPWLGNGALQVLASNDPSAIADALPGTGMLIVDEAHHLARGDDEQSRALYEHLCRHALTIPRLLLLSATPVLADADGFLRVLHLLDPVVFSLDDPAAFARRIEARQLIAEVAAGLVPENMLVLEDDLDRLIDAFGDDPTLMQLVEALRPILATLPEEDDEDFLAALGALRAYLGETCRLHRRILRNRRRTRPWVTPNRAGVQHYVYDCRLDAERASALERLRGLIALADAAPSLAVRTALLHAALHPQGTPVLRTRLVAAGLHDEAALDAADSVDRLAQECRCDDARIEALLRAIDDVLAAPGNVQIVVFCDLDATADTVYTALVQPLPGAVLRHGASADWQRFLHEPQTVRVLVCDARAEEGLNLHGGNKLVLHYDLPAAPNRIEQRLGRLDRFGTGTKIRSVALVNAADPAASAWLDLLDRGLGVFDRSVASLQYLIEDFMRTLVPAWLDIGPEAITTLTEQLAGAQGRVARELRRIDQQDALDALGAPPGEYFDVLEAQDDAWRELGRAVNAFAQGTLHLGKYPQPWTGPLPPTDSAFRWAYAKGCKQPPLIALDTFMQRFLGCLDLEAPGASSKNLLSHPYCYDRRAALSRAGRRLGVQLFRHGDPLFEALRRFCEDDDRGRAYAFWRHDPSYGANAAGEVDLCLRFDFFVEAAPPGLDAQLQALDSTSSVRETAAALVRRSEGLLPPQFVTVWVTGDGTASPEIPAAASRPYGKEPDEAGVHDHNLNAGRWRALHVSDRVPWLDDWAAICERARTSAEACVRTLPACTSAVAAALARTHEQHQLRAAQAAARLRRLTGIAHTTEQAEHAREAVLHQVLIDMIAKPALRLDAVGAMFVAAFDPFAA